jgi:hypothetical protein
MPFALCIKYSQNGGPRTLRLPGQLDDQRGEVETMIGNFSAGRWPAEGRFVVFDVATNAEGFRRRWADIKAIWIEES